jgi:hypothetical protein
MSPKASATFPPCGPAVLPPDLGTAETVEKGHGRIETRRIAVSSEVVPHLVQPESQVRTQFATSAHTNLARGKAVLDSMSC